MSEQHPVNEQSKDRSLENYRVEPGQNLTTDEGHPLSNTDDSLKAGGRGPTLLEDFHFQQKLSAFDRERIPERVVHARGAGAHGYFEPYESMAEFTKAKFLADPAVKTPVFVRFSTVGGSRGSADAVRDVRGFSVKFYTEDGNYDIVGNNLPVFFIQDAIKFPDIIHAVKPEPDNEMPQASTAHPSFWDFISLVPESMHMIMWLLSDRTLPRNFSTMQGFGVHTFRWVNKEGKSRFVKYHWKPLAGVHSNVFDEAQKIAGKDPDFQRRTLWESIEKGIYPEYELGVQIVEEEDEHKFDFDILDSTKIIPEELVPVRPIGKMVLNRNPDNFFAETEQVAYQPSNVVPGIDFSNDPLLQGRLMSYHDSQLHRLGSPNFVHLPINRPVCPFSNNNQDGRMQMDIKTSRVNYSPNSLGGNLPAPVAPEDGGFTTYPERVEGHKIRERSPSFSDHFSQATLFWNSLSNGEKDRLVEASHFELGKVKNKEVQERMIDRFNHVDHELAKRVAIGLGLPAPTAPATENHGRSSAALSQEHTTKTAKGRHVAILAADGVDGAQLATLKHALSAMHISADIVSKLGGTIATADGGDSIEVDKTFLTTASVLYDAVYVPGGAKSIEALKAHGEALTFIHEAFKHFKPIAGSGEGVDLLMQADLKGIDSAQVNGKMSAQLGVIASRDVSEMGAFATAFIDAIKEHRFWTRPVPGTASVEAEAEKLMMQQKERASA
ncbi:catalase [Chamaesiphon polymorphus]|uniref:Catalase n=1 Tax=Chamaesiphon polymorphus CCALA 037 TaxID=2107692 RepID=A0A2T1GGB2_9CYAN|nr:catalase [Chamaesiphon polymorphus]PSB56645.1 catalase HPII [Chamaesiphon polymorphus CCALA 037]